MKISKQSINQDKNTKLNISALFSSSKRKFLTFISSSFPYVATILFVISMISFVGTFLNLYPISFELTSKGVERFYSYYEGSIKLFGASLAIFSIYIAFARMNQTKEQLEKTQKQLELTEKQFIEAVDNYSFNNYYRHREFFKEYFDKSKYVEVLVSKCHYEKTYVIHKLYQFYYSENSTDFEPIVNTNSAKMIYDYITYLKENFGKLRTIAVLNFIPNNAFNILQVSPNSKQLLNLTQSFINNLSNEHPHYKVFQSEIEKNRYHICFFIGYYNLFLRELNDFSGEDFGLMDENFFFIDNVFKSYLGYFNINEL